MKVEKDIPMPRSYPFKDMEIGDSFLIAPDVKRINVQVAALRFRKKTGRAFAIRKTSQGYRCWRIE